MIIIDILIVILVSYAAYAGVRRGIVGSVLETLGLVLATLTSLYVYRTAGSGLIHVGFSRPQGNVVGFLLVWLLVEAVVAFAILAYGRWRNRRAEIVYKQSGLAPTSTVIDKIGGGAINVLKFGFVLTAALIVYSGLPVPEEAKRPVTSAYFPQLILDQSQAWRHAWSDGLGSDVAASFTTFVITTDPESAQRIQLGFTTTAGHVDEAKEAEMIKLVNTDRILQGLGPLTVNPGAQVVARAYAQRMLADGVFAHVDNDGKTPFDRLRNAGVPFGAAGENLALAPTLPRAHTGLMNSPGHRANILSKDYHKVGIGVIDAGQYGLMVVQDFTD